MVERVVILGAGQAGAQVAISLRQMGFGGDVVLLGDEPHPPYQRPPLSKKFLTGEVAADRAYIKPPSFYDQARIELRLGCRAAGIRRAEQVLVLESGERLAYDRLVLCSGTRPRRLPVPGTGLEGVLYLRTLADARRLREEVTAGTRAAIIGGGYIGLEVAASLRQLGAEVVVLEALPRVMSRVVAAPVSDFFTREHIAHGVAIMTGRTVEALTGEARVAAVLCTDGTRVAADLVVIGIGAVPNDELARAAGLETADGVVVDEHGRTGDSAIFAAGDVTNHPSSIFGRRLRLESVHNAMAQAKTVAACIAGRPEPYHEVPWFWSDQYDLKLQIAGLSSPGDVAVVRGDPASRAFSCLYLGDGVLRGLDAINRPADFIAAKRLIKEGAVLDLERARDPRIRLGA
jgi:3-phenylpropionate/trans-cinnamate dioxygenase ferredoxin reductase subunit